MIVMGRPLSAKTHAAIETSSGDDEPAQEMAERKRLSARVVHTLRASEFLELTITANVGAMSLPPPPEFFPSDEREEANDKENRWKLPPIHPLSPDKSPKSLGDDAPAWLLRSTLISEWDVSPDSKRRPFGASLSEWAVAAAKRTRPRRRSSVQSPTCV
jgi:hypothetical protein